MRQLLTSAILLLLVTGAAADDLFKASNAATWYLRAIEQYNRLTREDRAEIRAYGVVGGAPSQRVREVVARGRKVVDLVQRGAQRDYADFGLDYSMGPGTLLPHLGDLRAAARLMSAEAFIRLQDNDADGAARIVASMYRLADHLSDDRIIISSLVAMAVYKYADEVAHVAFDRTSFDAAQSARLLRSLRHLNRTDPFEMAEAVAFEQEIMVDWVATEYGGQNDMTEFVEFVGTFDAEVVNQLDPVEVDTATFDEHVELYDEAMTEVVAAFFDPDREAGRARLEALGEQIEAGEFGLVASVMTPALEKVLDRVVESRTMVQQRVAMLEGIVAGAVDPRTEGNAAYLYLKAIEMMQRIDPEPLARLRAFDADPAARLDEDLAQLIIDSQPTIDLLREASRLRRCDFSFARPDGPARIAPPYAAGMRDAARLVHVDAVRLLRQTDHDAATDRLVTLLGMAAHLGGDGRLVSARVAHRSFNRADRVIRDARSADALSETHRALLYDMMERVGRKDPFGYIAAVLAARQSVAAHFNGMVAADEDEGRRRREAAKAAMQLDGDQAIFIIIILDTMRRAGETEPLPEASFTPLEDILSVEALDAAGRLTPRVAPALAAAQLDVITGIDVTAIAQIAAHQRRARADLRAGLRRLRPQATTDAVAPSAPDQDADAAPSPPAQPR